MKKNTRFGTLYGFELRKIFKNRIAMIAFLIFFVFGFMQGELEVSGNIAPEILEIYRSLDGRVIDNELISEWNEACDEYGKAINDEDKVYESMEEWIKDIAGWRKAIGDLETDYLYSERLAGIEEAYEECFLNEGEKAYWRAQEEKIEKPFVWYDTFIAFGIQNGISNTIIIMLLVITAALSTIFASETQRKTDSMIRASVNGNKELYFAKILAGTTFAMASETVYLIVFLTYVRLRWGFGGLEVAEQIIYPYTQMDLNAKDVVIILIVLSLLGTFMLTAVTMFLSDILRNGVGTMAAMIGGYLGLFALSSAVPMQMKTLSKIINLFPGIQISPRLVYEFRLFKIGGTYLRSYQAAGISYVIISAALLILGYFHYKKYEIKSN